ncbi:Photosynthetic reaction center cytochrome C subunit [Granulicella rosea]|uniref:Photosynthetic reaction center cytochrome c subunit n=1 Tax=Granulicella rosea TaxID=474952 RepID=A0A239HWS0_9BACT|nr:c-type cytochrome [Granulicella rosea]SNS84654.1 Photosynthetic reaction center cytochrome C subunit [Granulicella rosea]
MSVQLRRTSFLSLTFLLGAAVCALAQAPAAPQPPRGPRPKPTNIQALPKDISGDETIKYMHAYEDELGVECSYCHAKNPETKRNDFASDANPMKEKARTMIRMTAEINAKYLAALGSTPAPAPVGCGTCHRGMAKPPAFVPKPHEMPPAAPKPAM